MKTKLFTIAIALSSVVAMAQKKEIKNAEKAIEDGNYAEAKAHLSSVESLIPAEKEKVQAEFYYLKGTALIGKNNTNTEEIISGAEALSKAARLGNADAQTAISNLKTNILTTAEKNYSSQNYKKAASELYLAYNLDKTDTINLYYAADSAIRAKDLDAALAFYKEMDQIGYSGEKMYYTAKNNETGEVDNFETKNQRDLYIKAGSHSKPGVLKEESKRPEIVSNIAKIYLQKGDKENAMAALKKARSENPKDTALILAEASVYYEAKEYEKYNNTIQEVLKLEPNNATLYYNLGVTSTKAKNLEKAEEYYKKAIQIDPSMTGAYNNLASVLLEKEQPLVDEQNNLGMSAADNKRYDAIQKERKELYKSIAPYLEKVIELEDKESATYQNAKQTLSQIYMFLGEDEKANALKN